MFCPGCGIGEERTVPFCRTCGTDLRAVRISLEQPEAVMLKADSARLEIGRAIADKIRDADGVEELEDVLPEIEKFFESPEERKLRRMRQGVITAMVGAGATIAFLLLSLVAENTLFLSSLGVIVFLIGIGIVANGVYFSIPPSSTKSGLGAADDHQSLAENMAKTIQGAKREIAQLRGVAGVSVTENTTRHLASESRDTSPKFENPVERK